MRDKRLVRFGQEGAIAAVEWRCGLYRKRCSIENARGFPKPVTVIDMRTIRTDRERPGLLECGSSAFVQPTRNEDGYRDLRGPCTSSGHGIAVVANRVSQATNRIRISTDCNGKKHQR